MFRNPGRDVPVQQLFQKLQGFQAKSGVPASKMQEHDKYHGSDPLLRERFPYRDCVGQDMIPLDFNPLLLRNKFSAVIPQACRNAVNSFSFTAETLHMFPAGLHSLFIFF